jgi:hypothetical protein
LTRRSLASVLVALAIGVTLDGQPPNPPPPIGLAISFGDPRAALVAKDGTFASGAVGPGKTQAITAGEKGNLRLESQAPSVGPRQVTALIRLRTDVAASASAQLAVGRADDKDSGLRVSLSTTRDAGLVSCSVTLAGKPLHDLAVLSKTMDWEPQNANGFTYHPRAYPFKDIRPGWPEDYRARIEADMAALPDVPDKWLPVRVELRSGEVRVWLDDRLVAWKADPALKTDGGDQLILSPGVQLAAFNVIPLPPTPGFEPVRIDGYANGRGFVGNVSVKPDGLPHGEMHAIGGVPFAIPAPDPEGNDHIDVSKSLYRQANDAGYMPSMTVRWFGASHRDPARIQLRIPNRPYEALYLLAAADEKPDTVPIVSAMFYRPSAGFAETFEGKVPAATAEGPPTARVPVTLANGKQVSLWLVRIPLDPGRLSAFADMDVVEVELTKKVHQFRSYPDPILYGYHQGGLPSSVHIYGVTLGLSPVAFGFEPDKFGHVWTAPAVPSYTGTVTNLTPVAQVGSVTVVTRSYDGSEVTRQVHQFQVPPGGTAKLPFSTNPKLNGYHDVAATINVSGRTWTENRSLVRLAPDTRAEKWTEGQGALFGYWSYHGGHHTPKAKHHVELMTEAGARTSIGIPVPDHPLIKKHWARTSAGAWEVSPQPWAADDPVDPKKVADFQKATVEAFTKHRNAIPPEFRPDHVYFFPEPHVSQRLTEGNYPDYWHGDPLTYTADEQKRLTMFMRSAQYAAEVVRKEFPDLKILIPWGDALFAVPLLRAGFPKNLIDGSGIDTPGFERLPEMQLHQISVHRLYELRKEYEKAGIPSPRFQYTEGIFVPTEPGAVSWREQMDIYNRWVLISMAYGVNRFYSGWFAFDCTNYYGSEHYGGCGIQNKIPYCNPKPAYAAYATMTDKLDRANFDGWLKTGSLTTYCLRFKGPKGHIYTLWTLRGKRPVTLTLATDGDVSVTDTMNNTRVLKSQGHKVTITTDPSVTYVSATAEVASVAVGEPDHSDPKPPEGAKPVADLGDGSWSFGSERNKTYENGTFAMSRYPGKFASAIETDPVHGKVLRSTLGKQDAVHELMPWYSALVPKKPIPLTGAPSHLGLWVKGASDWGRIVYVLKDAKGETWTSIGTQDQYNCDDAHSWSAFNFDGWRYVRFEVPGHTGYDAFRKHGSTWWRSDGGDGIVDLPLTLDRIIVEQRTHVLYVNDVQPVASDSVSFGKLYAEYVSPADATPEAVRIGKLRMPPPPANVPLPNPIADHQKDSTLEPTAITKLEPPLDRNDGTTVHVHFKEVPGAAHYQIWVCTRPDGRGAVNMTPGGAKSGVLIRDLRPKVSFYFWVTYRDAAGKWSKPSAAMTATLADTFGEK